MAQKLVLCLDKDVQGRDFNTKQSFKFDLLYVLINSFKIKVKPVDDTSRDLIYQALEQKQELQLYYETVDAKDDEGNPFTYERIYSIVKDIDSEDVVYVKAKDTTGKAKILNALKRYELTSKNNIK